MPPLALSRPKTSEKVFGKRAPPLSSLFVYSFSLCDTMGQMRESNLISDKKRPLGASLRPFVTLCQYPQNTSKTVLFAIVCYSLPTPETKGLKQAFRALSFFDQLDENETTRGYATRGYATRGYATRGYATRGYATRGYATRGYATRGYATRGYATRGYAIGTTKNPLTFGQGAKEGREPVRLQRVPLIACSAPFFRDQRLAWRPIAFPRLTQ